MKKIFIALAALFVAGSFGFKAKASSNDIQFQATKTSITFDLNKMPLAEDEEFMVTCNLTNKPVVSQKSTAKKITLTDLWPNSEYQCEVKTVSTMENSSGREIKVVQYSSGEFPVITENRLRILDHKMNFDAVEVTVSKVELSENEVYFLDCVHQEDATRREPQALSTEPVFTMHDLDWFTPYKCSAGVTRQPAGRFVQESEVVLESENSFQLVTGGKQEVVVDEQIGFAEPVIKDYSNYTQPFPDVYMNSKVGTSVAELYRRGVISGHEDGRFNGSYNVNRAEAAKLLLLARYKHIPDHQNTYEFEDIYNGRWYTKYVMMAANKDIIHGYDDFLFRPTQGVNTAEFIKMLSRSFELPQNLEYSYQDVPANEWFAVYAGAAEKMNLFPDRKELLYPNKKLTRYEVAVALYQALDFISTNPEFNCGCVVPKK